MKTKTLTVKGLPALARTAMVASHAEHEGTHVVVVHVSQFDTYGFPNVTAVHTMSAAEALDLAARLTEAAKKCT